MRALRVDGFTTSRADWHLLGCCALALLGWLAGPAVAREQLDPSGRFEVRWWTTEDGLPETPLVGIASAADGTIVCGSRSRLIRFDGMTISPFPKKLTDQLHAAIGDFWSIGFDGQGRLWVQGGRAVARLDAPAGIPSGTGTGHWTVYWLSVPAITGMTFGSDGRPICIGADSVEVFVDNGFAPLPRPAGPAAPDGPSWRYGRADPRTGILWLWTGGGQGGVWQFIPPALGTVLRDASVGTGLLRDPVVSVGVGPTGTWALLSDGVAVHRESGWQRLPLKPAGGDSAGGGSIVSGKIAEATDGTVWISTHDALLAYRDGSVEATIDGLPGFSFFTHGLAADGCGGIWAGCAGGLLNVRRRSVRVDPLPACTAAFVRPDGTLLVGSPGAVELRRHDPAGALISRETVASLPPHAVPTALLETPDGCVWVGTQDAFLMRIDGGSVTQVTRPVADSFRELRSIQSLARDEQGRIWAGTSNGLARYDPALDTFVLQAEHGGTSPLRIIGLAAQRDGSLLVGASGRGVDRLLPDGTVTRIVRREAMPGRRSVVFHRDSRNALWIGGDLGLLRIAADGSTTRLSTATGLVDDAVRQIDEDETGRLWVAMRDGHLQGLRLLDIDALAMGTVAMVRGVVVRVNRGLDAAECLGLASRECSDAPVSSRRLVVPLTRGILLFDPASIPPPAPAMHAPTISAALQPDGALGFQYRSPGMHLDDLPLHQSLLHGIDSGWSAPSRDGSREYRGLPPGRYVFTVRRIDGETDASFPQSATAIDVPRRWWQRPAVVATACGAAAVAAIWASRRVAAARAHRAEAALARERDRERDRARIARDIHDSLGAGLTRMALMSENARRAACSPEDLDRRLDAIYRDAHGLARSVDEIVWAVNPQNDTLGGFVAFTMQEVEDSAGAAGLRLSFDVQNDLPAMPLDATTRHHLFLAVREAVQNILRHSDCSAIGYGIRIVAGWIEVVIEDDGRGFEPTDDTTESQDGLRNIRARLDELGGRVQIRSAPGCGTVVSLAVPLTSAVTGRSGGEPKLARKGDASDDSR